MSLDWQTCVVLAVVAAAVAYLARAAWQSVAQRRAAACGGCGTCPASNKDSAPQVVEIQALGQQRSGESLAVAATPPADVARLGAAHAWTNASASN